MMPDDDDESGSGGPVIDPKRAGQFAPPPNETLGQKQRRFVRMVAALIDYAHANGYELSFGDAYRDPRVFGHVGEFRGYGNARSAHKQRLAIDLNLFRGGVYLSDTESHRPLGEWWESIGGSWGGRFRDGNHYSIEHNGVK